MRIISPLVINVLALGLAACASVGGHDVGFWPDNTDVQVTIYTHAEEEILTGQTLSLDEDGGLSLERDGGDLKIRWWDAGWAGVRFEVGADADMSALRQGHLGLVMKLEDMSNAGVEIALLGAGGLERRLPVDRQLQPMVGRGWQKVSLPIACLIRTTDNADEIFAHLRLGLGGSGQMSLSSAAIYSEPATDAIALTCPDNDTLAVTPAPLDAHWARSWWMPRHQQKLAEAAGGNPQIVLLGDSITQGWEDAGREVFEQHFGRWRTLNLGFGGDRTENVLWRLQQGAVDGVSPELVVMMIGTNNTGHRQDQPEQTAKGIEMLLQELRVRLPESKILLLAIFPRGAEADDLLRRINEEINRRIRQFADNETVFFADINAVLLDEQGRLPEMNMPDLLHPNAEGYELIARELVARINDIVAEF